MNEHESSFRSFSLYNFRGKHDDLLEPGAVVDTEELRFNTLGYFDEFRTKRILVKEKNGNMPELWDTINKMNAALIDESRFNEYSSKSYQNIFGFPYTFKQHGDSSDHFVSDEIFWQDNDYPYIFTILVQFFDRNEGDYSGDALKNKIDSYIKKYIEHIRINFEEYEEVFSAELVKEADGDGVFLEGDKPETYIGFTPGEEDKKYILTDYITFDRYDYILCVKSKCYLPFVLATQQLHSLLYSTESKSFSSVGSFTVTAINHMYTGKIAEEIIPSICIKCNYAEDKIFFYNQQHREEIICNPGKCKFNILHYMRSYQEKLKSFLYSDKDQICLDSLKLDNYFKMYYISGENDVRFISRYIRASRIISLITLQDSPLRDVFLGGFSTSINVTNNKTDVFTPKPLGGHAETVLCGKILECKRMISELSKKGYPVESIKIMNQINSGLCAIMPQNSFYRGYGFFSLFPDFFALIKRTYTEIVRGDGAGLSKQHLDNTQDLIQFIGAALLTTIRSDFKEFQIPTFNANLYYTPTKLLVFYRAFIMFFMKYYAPFYEKSEDDYGKRSAQKSRQHFIIAPGNKFGAIVFEKVGGTYNDGKLSERYFSCEISEKNIYYLKNTMIILSHEVSHYGMKTVRNRKDRYTHIVQTYIYAFLITLLGSLTSKLAFTVNQININRINKDNQDDILFRLSNCFLTGDLKQELFDRIFSLYGFCDIKKENHEKNKYHYSKVISTLENNIFEIKEDIRELVFNRVYTGMQEALLMMEELEITEKLKLNEKIKKAIHDSIEIADQTVFSNINNKLLSSVSHFVYYHYEEVFSDLLCILTLDLSPEDYYAALLEEERYKVEGKNEIQNRNLGYRFSLVTDSLINFRKKIGELAVDNHHYREIIEYASSLFHDSSWTENNMCSSLLKTYRSVTQRQFDVFAVPFNDDHAFNWYREILVDRKQPTRILFYDRNIYQCIIDYMTGCVINYFDQMKSNHIDELVLSPRQIYNEINSVNMDYDEKALCIDRFLSQFENQQFISLNNLSDEE